MPKPPSGRATNYKHGMIKSPEYVAWISMKDRCLNPKSSNYAGWGGRGVRIHEPWVNDFIAFCMYVGHRPGPDYSLDRYPNPNGNYEPGNVRWASKAEQSLNRRPVPVGEAHGNYAHGGTKTPEYKTWASIKTRCFNEKHEKFSEYGAAGITMCSRWRGEFSAFLEDVGVKPSPQHTLLRVDRSGHYSCGKCPECTVRGWPANCRWGSRTEQNRTRRTSGRTGKLDVERVASIRARSAAGENDASLAEIFGVARSLIGKIRRGEVWA
jgi:hypothetical protein